jgi:hypothetical protein
MRGDATQKDSMTAACEDVIDGICRSDWHRLTADELVSVAWAYYFFSIQFRENLEIALDLHPDDALLRQLDRGERNTDNLSPWPGVAAPGETMHHDEFMRRTLRLTAIDESRRCRLEAIGQAYLAKVRVLDKMSRAMSIASYETGGLDAVFRAILTALRWEGPLLQAFRHFLSEHIKFDSDPQYGHGALCLHLAPDNRVLPLWTAFARLLGDAVPGLAGGRGS